MTDGRKDGEASWSERTEKALDDLDLSAGLPGPLPQESRTEASRLLNLPPSVLEGMTAEQCGEAAFVLSQFAWHLQRLHSRQIAKAKAAEEGVLRLVAPFLSSAKGWNPQERILSAMESVPAAKELDRERAGSLVRAEQTRWQSNRVEKMSDRLAGLQAIKRTREGNGNGGR